MYLLRRKHLCYTYDFFSFESLYCNGQRVIQAFLSDGEPVQESVNSSRLILSENEAGISNGSLLINPVLKIDSGNYICLITQYSIQLNTTTEVRVKGMRCTYHVMLNTYMVICKKKCPSTDGIWHRFHDDYIHHFDISKDRQPKDRQRQVDTDRLTYKKTGRHIDTQKWRQTYLLYIKAYKANLEFEPQNKQPRTRGGFM